MIISRKRYEREMNREQERLLELDAMNSNIKALAKEITGLTIRVRKLEVDLITHIGRETQGTLRDEKLVRCQDCNKSKEWPNGRWCSLFRASVNTDSYCSFGAERRR